MYTRKHGFNETPTKCILENLNETSNVYSKTCFKWNIKCILENLVLMKHQMYTRKPALNETSMYPRKPGFNETPTKCILENLVLMKHQMYTRKPALNETSNVYSKTWF